MSEEPIILHKRRRVSRIVPFGFDVDSNDSTLLIPNLDKYRVIIEARKMKERGAPYGELKTFIHNKLGIVMHPMEISRLMKRKY